MRLVIAAIIGIVVIVTGLDLRGYAEHPGSPRRLRLLDYLLLDLIVIERLGDAKLLIQIVVVDGEAKGLIKLHEYVNL